ncbi:HNH endonuclease [Sediminibacterium sp.]|uniref:HNH endonuclease n=1 Tax=Sediminibacterium sp. TaxID=1917865 RepID=UPI003F7230BD
MNFSLFPDEEQWKPIKEFPQYLVSSQGRVKHTLTGKMKVQKREVQRRKNGTVSSAYLLVILSDFKGKDGNTYRRFVHRLVAIAFLGNPPTPEHTVDHIDTNPLNNNLNNLRWATKKEQFLNNRISNKWPISLENLPHEERLKTLDKLNLNFSKDI